MQVYTTEEEQLQFIVNWFKKHGLTLAITAIVLLSIVIGRYYWQNYNAQYLAKASNIYEQFQNTSDESLQQKLADKLSKNYKASIYGKIAAVYKANQLVSQQKWQEAADQYKVIYKNAGEWPDFQIVVLENWVRSLLELNQNDQALKVLVQSESNNFDKLYPLNFYNLKGDILASQNNNAKAIDAYNLALDSIKNNPALAQSMVQFANWVMLKRNDLVAAQPLA